MATRIPLYVFSHHRKIANLYKSWLRYLEGSTAKRIEYFYLAAEARAEFDVIFNEKDMIKSKRMLMEKQAEFNKFVFPPVIFPTSPEGVSFSRTLVHDDSCLDHWHPYEKAAFPEYFARREIRKQQFVELWEKMHGPPKPDEYPTDH